MFRGCVFRLNRFYMIFINIGCLTKIIIFELWSFNWFQLLTFAKFSVYEWFCAAWRHNVFQSREICFFLTENKKNMLNTISDLMARVKGREILDSSVCFMISCFGMLTSVFIISLIFDSIDRIDRLEIYYKFIFVVTSLMLVFFAGISLLKFLSKCKSKIALNIRLSLYLIKKHKVPLFVVSLLITAIAYMIFLNMAKT